VYAMAKWEVEFKCTECISASIFEKSLFFADISNLYFG